eukprot:TRINITY_DN3054_c0_g1_i1.p1 TRINITY_DN3054_c0_g1~~TRINITY_DN3054_c0_g1_i1.p1  ORF type:complete len:673 (-),score=182.73 TRINITY_DN3054_c0_g1_i1:85-1896(-)
MSVRTALSLKEDGGKRDKDSRRSTHSHGHSIKKPTNARHLMHIARDPDDGGLLLVRGDSVIRLSEDDTNYQDLQWMSSLFDEDGVSPRPLSQVGISTTSSPIAFPPRNAIQLNGMESESESSEFLLAEVTKAKDKDKDGEEKEKPDLAKFSSPVFSPILRTSLNGGIDSHLGGVGGPGDMTGESDTAESTIEEEIRSVAKRKSGRRETLIEEFVRSEGSHVEALKSVLVDYLGPLRERKVLEAQEMKDLFCNIELILSWNMDFLHSLRTRWQEYRSGLVPTLLFGDVFIKASVILRQLFSQYNQNYPLAQVTYANLRKTNLVFHQFILKATESGTRSNLLASLYLPIQRIIIIDSLLKDIVLLTPSNHADYENLSIAYKLLRSMELAADRVAEKRKNMDTVLRIQTALNGTWDIAEPHRRFVYEDELFVVVGKSLKERTMYLFSDILLVTKPKKKKFDVDALVKLEKLTVTPYGNDRHIFKLTAPGEEFWVHSNNKSSWLQLLHSSIKKLNSPPVEIDDLRNEEAQHVHDQKSSKFERELRERGATVITKTLLMKKITKWATIRDPEKLQKEVRRMASRVSTYQALQSELGVTLEDSEDLLQY